MNTGRLFYYMSGYSIFTDFMTNNLNILRTGLDLVINVRGYSSLVK